MTAVGGRALIEQVRSIRWSGTAAVFVGAKTIDLGVETVLEPFVRARSDSWLVMEGRSTRRTLMIEGDQGFKVVDRQQSALSPAATINERQQFGVYGYMLMAGARWTAGRGGRMRGERTGFPPIEIACGPDGRIKSADYVVASPDQGGQPIREHFAFAGTMSDKGVNWPHKIAIVQDGKPFFALSIDEFVVTLR
ncbi:MAG: hypothetical protein JWN66_2788 [Sphingomonas bacterium]|jgi:hypothetical protein|uniref:hypothetical protein n=1 Tax=Sphingomonas bacterium TaxID=1895847 RepID=UPI00261EC596|nr:hypothetical protein [Sphingomonas bacterium]MDB5705672.1 hypothetical protein [Sphingomonas bacterium]